MSSPINVTPQSNTTIFNAAPSKAEVRTPIYVLAQVILCENSNSLDSSHAGVNIALATQLFRSANDLDKQPHYIRVADRVYRAILFKIVNADQATLILSPFQKKDADISSSSVLVSEFVPDGRNTRKERSFEIHLHRQPNDEVRQEHLTIEPYPLLEAQITSNVERQCKEQILHNDQNIMIHDQNKNVLSATLRFLNHGDYEPKFVHLGDNINIKYIYNHSQVMMIEANQLTASSILFKFDIVNESNSRALHEEKIQESIVFDQKSLISHFMNLLGKKQVCLGQIFKFQFRGFNLQFCVERIDSHYLAKHTLSEKMISYDITNAKIDFKINSSSVHIGQGTPIRAEKCEITVLKRLNTSSVLEKDGPAWISSEDLYIELKGRIAINGQVLRISLPDAQYLITTSFVAPKSACQRFFSNQFYDLDMENIYADSADGVKIVISNNKYPLKSVRARVLPKKNLSSAFLSLSPEDPDNTKNDNLELRDLINAVGNVNYPIYEKAIINVKIRGQLLSLEIDSLEAQVEDQITLPITISSGKWIGVVTDKTLISVQNDPAATGIILRDKAAPVSDRATLLKELKETLGGLDHVFQQICNIITQSRGGMVEEARKRGIQPVRGLLLYGPPGTGKTSTARLIGKLLNCKPKNTKSISGTDVLSKWVGETEKTIRHLFEPAQRDWAEFGEKSDLHLLLIDELDGLLPDRNNDRLPPHAKGFVNAFLAKMDGFDQMHNLFVIGLTNRLADIDPAARRHGRFSRKIEIGLPTLEGRKEIFRIYTKTIEDNQLLGGGINYDTLAGATDGASGAEIRGMVEFAASLSLERMEKFNLTKEQMPAYKDRMVTMQDLMVGIKYWERSSKTLLGRLLTGS